MCVRTTFNKQTTKLTSSEKARTHLHMKMIVIIINNKIEIVLHVNYLPLSLRYFYIVYCRLFLSFKPLLHY